MTEIIPGLKGMNGGTKMHYLNMHRAQILADYEQLGEAATRKKYNIKKQETWDRLLNGKVSRPKTKLTKVDRLEARVEMVEQGQRASTRRVNEIEDHFGKFVPYLAEQMTEKFFIPLMRGKIELPPELEEKPAPDPLSLADFPWKLKK